MTRWRRATGRVLFAVFAIYLVISATFGFVTLTADPNVGAVAYETKRQAAAENANQSETTAMVREAVAEYRERHNLDEPLAQRYLRWLVDVTTLDWGRSYSHRAPVVAVLGGAIGRTAVYVVPALLVALVGGIGLGVHSALRPGSLLERVTTGGVYLGLGVPNYWLALFAGVLGADGAGTAFYDAPFFRRVVLPASILGVTMLAGQYRYARAESNEYVHAAFVKLVRAKGATDRRLGRHVLRNAALPLFSLFFADLVGALVVEIFVIEEVLAIRGIGGVGLAAIQARDLPLVLGVTMVFAIAGVVGNLLQDLAYLAFDPRVDSN